MTEPAIPSDLPHDPAPAARRRPYRVNVRLTREEYGHLREQARLANQRPATLTRGLIMGARLKAVPKFPDEVYRAIRSLSGNLNQLAHQANMGRVDRDEVGVLRVLMEELLRILLG
jgi:hypothetical protein